MWIFYTCALIPIFIGAILLWKDEKVVWQEWLMGAGAALLLALLMQLISCAGMTSDVETWSGDIYKVSYYPRWVEQYEQKHSETTYTGSGKNRKSHTRHWYTTEHTTHHERWEAFRNFGVYMDDVEISKGVFDELSTKFGGKVYDDGKQSYRHSNGRFVGGDRNIYSINNVSGRIEPVTSVHSFENKIKAAPSTFSFTKVPTNISVYAWPYNPDWRKSNRLLGNAAVLVDQYKWDCLNTSVGPLKGVNLIMVGFGNRGSEYGQWQQAAWIGGKKNDLVITFGGGSKSNAASWVYVFGWTERELVKRNIESILLNNPINDDIIPLISAEVRKNYVIKDWNKFDYITIEPPAWSYWVYFSLLIVTQVGLYILFHTNDFSKESETSSYDYNRYKGYRWPQK